jgi:hypothetical protein
MNQANRVYTVMLVMLAIFLVIGIGQMSRWHAPLQRGQIVLDYLKVIYSVYLAAVILTLVLRATNPGAGKVAATALNLALLAMIPFGTVVGVFGLAKLDKEKI